ncbi:MAG: aminoacyl-tRNA hydrolase [Candidatus Saccharimonadales bacterium]
MKLIVGLGNLGAHFDGTRHNVGFAMCDIIATVHGAEWTKKDKFKAHIAELKSDKILLVKPTTYYNLSGETVRAVMDFYKLSAADVLVIHDELALSFGTVRTRVGGSDAGNNGIKSISQHIGSEYARIRIGIANEHTPRNDAADFVLSRLGKEESETLQKDLAPKVAELVHKFAAGDFPHDTHKV